MTAQPITDAWDDLDDALSEPLPIESVDAIDPTMAERMLRRVLRLRRQYDADEAVAKAQREQVDAWLARRKARMETDTAYLEECLRQYHEARLAEDPKARTIHLPSGTLAARKKPDAWVFDDDAFIEWAQARTPELLRTKVEIDRPTVKQTLVVNDDGRVLHFDSGEFVDSVRVEPGEVTFTLKPGDDQ